jgi:hypothetical protein
MRKAIILLAAILAVGPTALVGQKYHGQAEPIKVFVFAADAVKDPAESVFDDAKKRDKRLPADAVVDIKKTLAKNKKSFLQVVSERDDADVVVEVLFVGDVGSGSMVTRRDPSGDLRTYEDTIAACRINLTVGTYLQEFEGRDVPNPWNGMSAYRPYRGAAEDAARHIQHWIRYKYGDLISERAAKVGKP